MKNEMIQCLKENLFFIKKFFKQIVLFTSLFKFVHYLNNIIINLNNIII